MSGTNRSGAALALEDDMERLRPGLTGYCYRMLGSGFEAEDATQETLLRAWRRADTLADPAALKSWLFSIATNVCLDQIDARRRRARPIDLADPGTAESPVGAPLPETAWVLPIADGQVIDPDADPEARAAERETLRLAFVAALQHLPARQRVVLVLREVLRWSAKEVADVLETSVASVNSALQRARATLDELDLADADAPARPSTEDESRLLEQYLEAFAEYDIDRIVALLRYDVVFDMPPLPLWLRGPTDVGAFMLGPGAACRGSKLIALSANGLPAYASYKPDPGSGAWLPWSLTLLEMEAGDGATAASLTAVHNFLAPFLPDLFASFGLPDRLGAADPAIVRRG
ncbi:MAG TPA: sigma-70 family RNA polymerase sigma factor [Solirubrobacterales bacterium]|nr:sigma-70 family RNA polymerase sigma factor [Solirubrobacterales bacterium]